MSVSDNIQVVVFVFSLLAVFIPIIVGLRRMGGKGGKTKQLGLRKSSGSTSVWVDEKQKYVDGRYWSPSVRKPVLDTRVRCPKCGSVDLGSVYGKRWQCHSCDYIFT